MPFEAQSPDEPIGIDSTIWRFSSSLTKDSSGRLEVCYTEGGDREQILGTVAVYPFVSNQKMPDLRILFARDMKSVPRRVVVIVGYGIRSGVFVAEVPGLTSHPLVSSGSPKANSQGEVTLTGFGDGSVSINAEGPQGLRGRLFFRYVSADNP